MTTATETYDKLRQRLLDGDSSITAAALEKARRDAEYAELKDEADRLADERAAQAQHDLEVEHLHRDIAALGDDAALKDLRDTYRQMVTAAEKLQDGVARWNADRAALAVRAKDLGLPAQEVNLPTLQTPEEYAALAVQEAQGQLKWTPASTAYWKPGHELHTPDYIAQAEADAQKARDERAKRREAQEAERREAAAREKAEREAAQEAAERRRRAMDGPGWIAKRKTPAPAWPAHVGDTPTPAA